MTVSVVMATFQGERFLEHQLKSIVEGTLPPDEIVIVDDASGDGTMALLERLTSGDTGPRFKLYQNEINQGATKSFVRGVKHTSGDVVFFADQDDVWHPEKIARVAKAFKDGPGTIMVHHDGVICDASLEPSGRSIYGTRKRAELGKGMERDPMEVAGNPDVKGCTMAADGAFLRQLFTRSDPSFARYWGHDHWAALFAFAAGRVIALPDQLIQHRFHGRNDSAAVGFDPFAPAHWVRYMKAIKTQEKDHFVQRYRVALEHLDLMSFENDGALRDALDRHLAIAFSRFELRSLGPRSRLASVLALHRKGIYSAHFNGWPTLMRDLLL